MPNNDMTNDSDFPAIEFSDEERDKLINFVFGNLFFNVHKRIFEDWYIRGGFRDKGFYLVEAVSNVKHNRDAALEFITSELIKSEPAKSNEEDSARRDFMLFFYDMLYTSADKFIDNGQYKEAIARLSHVNVDIIGKYSKLGFCYLMLNDYKKAFDNYFIARFTKFNVEPKKDDLALIQKKLAGCLANLIGNQDHLAFIKTHVTPARNESSGSNKLSDMFKAATKKTLTPAGQEALIENLHRLTMASTTQKESLIATILGKYETEKSRTSQSEASAELINTLHHTQELRDVDSGIKAILVYMLSLGDDQCLQNNGKTLFCIVAEVCKTAPRQDNSPVNS